MNIDDFMIMIIEKYINNEINYIYQDIEQGKKAGYSTNSLKKDLKFLEDLNFNDFNNILKKLENESNFMDQLDETIHEFIYNYEKKEV